MMLSYDLTKSPGRWRLGTIYVKREATGEIVYEGPEADQVPTLMAELVQGLRESGPETLVRGAMAHLNLVMIHPFRDGNGRMARCLQTLVLARDGYLAPEFSSIEEYLGRNTDAYYDVLGAVGGGRWQPGLDARPWLRFCLTAHFHQAQTLLRRVREAEDRWEAVEALAVAKGAPERSIPALFNASMGFRIRNATYRVHSEVSDLVASRDLRALVERGLLEPKGERRGRFYVRSTALVEIDLRVRATRPAKGAEDPFAQAREQILRPTLGLGLG
jgi:Fic family protein